MSDDIRDREFLGKGLAFPLQFNPRGEIALANGERDIEQSIHLILSNPAYAGAYAYGRRRRDGGVPGLSPPGPRRRFALDELAVLLQVEPGFHNRKVCPDIGATQC